MKTIVFIAIFIWIIIKRYPFRLRGEKALAHIPYKEEKQYHSRGAIIDGDVLHYACTLYHQNHLYSPIASKKSKCVIQREREQQVQNINLLFQDLYKLEAADLLSYNISDITSAFDKIARDYRDSRFAEIYPTIQNRQERQRAREEYEQQLLTDLSECGLSPNKYLQLANTGKIQNFVGCYIIYNISKSKAYVGQSKNVRKRLQQHFSGEGCIDVYADYLSGDEFRIKTITLRDYGIDDLDKMEKELISKYHAFDRGYNKTRGNG